MTHPEYTLEGLPLVTKDTAILLTREFTNPELRSRVLRICSAQMNLENPHLHTRLYPHCPSFIGKDYVTGGLVTYEALRRQARQFITEGRKKMGNVTSDGLPVVSKVTLETFFYDEPEESILTQAILDFTQENPSLTSLIELFPQLIAKEENRFTDPSHFYGGALIIYHLLRRQASANQLEEQLRLSSNHLE